MGFDLCFASFYSGSFSRQFFDSVRGYEFLLLLQISTFHAELMAQMYRQGIAIKVSTDDFASQ